MERLKGLVVADPVESVAQLVARHCERLAEERLFTTGGERTIAQVASLRPEMVVLSLEITKPDAVEVAKAIQKIAPDTFIIITFREMAVPMMEKLGKLEVGDFIAQPVDFAAIFRAASKRFGTVFRRHERHSVTLDIQRADGVLIGKTRDLSEGGLMMDAIHPFSVDESLLVDLGLPEKPLRVRCHVLAVDGQPPAKVTARVMFENLRGREHERLVGYLADLGKQARPV